MFEPSLAVVPVQAVPVVPRAKDGQSGLRQSNGYKHPAEVADPSGRVLRVRDTNSHCRAADKTRICMTKLSPEGEIVGPHLDRCKDFSLHVYFKHPNMASIS
jgi:hypothetical protein